MPAIVGIHTFKQVTRQDLLTVHAWLQRPYIAEWWREPRSLVELEHDYLPPISSQSSTRAYIALLDGEPIGFIQSYVVVGSGGGWWETETDPGARGIDQFLAREHQLGRGLGSAVVRAFVEQLFQNPEVTRIQADPSPENERAIRSYSRAGFVPVREIVTPDGPAILMLRERSSR